MPSSPPSQDELQKRPKLDIKQLSSVDEMNALMYQISTCLVQDKQKLSRWIAGIQQGFASLYFLLMHLF